MVLGIFHKFVNPKADGGDATITQPSGWNDDHSIVFGTVEKDLGNVALASGTFDITGLTGLTANKPVLVRQAAGPYTGKGDLEDEAEMDQAIANGFVLSATAIRVFWQSVDSVMGGNVKFLYLIGG